MEATYGHQIGHTRTHPLLESAVTEQRPSQNSGPLISTAAVNGYYRTVSNVNDELWQFRLGLLWLGLQQLTKVHAIFSWIIFIVSVLVIPLYNVLYVVCLHCNESQQHPFEEVVQISESALCTIGFLGLTSFLRTYGLRRMLFLDQIGRESAEVQHGYQNKLQDAFQLLVKVLLPCFIVELIHKIMWFMHASVTLPFINNRVAQNVIMCCLLMLSWLYRAAVFMLMCVLFRLTCSLQILRFRGYYKLLQSTADCSVILQEHLRIRDQLSIISHRFRIFLLSSLITITLSQFASLFIVTANSGAFSFSKVGDLAVCSATQLIGFVLCLHGAAKITHRAQRIVSIVSHWHAVATCIDTHMPSDAADNTNTNGMSVQQYAYSNTTVLPIPHVESNEDLEAAYNNIISASIPYGTSQRPAKYSSRSYFRRQALVTYFRHCNGAISIYGFAVDRGSIYGIFMLELSLMLWTLGKTILVAHS